CETAAIENGPRSPLSATSCLCGVSRALAATTSLLDNAIEPFGNRRFAVSPCGFGIGSRDYIELGPFIGGPINACLNVIGAANFTVPCKLYATCLWLDGHT